MNNRTRVIELRQKGKTYRQISEHLNLPIGTVKTICARHNVEQDLVANCKYCNKTIVSFRGKKQKKFCDDKCRMAWWNSNRHLVNSKTNYFFTCKYCGNKFTSDTHKNRKYCSHACYLEGRYGNAK